MKVDYDVIIIGAGPAGAGCAKQLTHRGASVLIVEKKELPRYKCCAGMYSERTLSLIKRDFGQLPEELYCDTKKINIKISKSGKNFKLLEHITFCNIIRDRADHWLIQQSGARVQTKTKVLDIEQGREITIKIKSQNGPVKTLTCSYLVGADGAFSFVRRKLDAGYTKKKLDFVVQQVYKAPDTIDKQNYHVIMNKKYSQAFSFFLIKNDLLYVGSSMTGFNSFLAFFCDYYQVKSEPLRRECCYIDFFYDEKKVHTGKDNILLTGEAAGLMSTFGEGVPSALNSGNLAARSILEKKSYENLLQEEIALLRENWSEAGSS